MKKLFASLIALGLAAAVSMPAHAAFPTRSINCMNPYLAGGILEVTVRPVVDAMSRILPKGITITNHAGGGGVIGLTKFVSQKKDGYTITVCSDMTVFCLAKFRNVRFRAEDFRPIGAWADTSTALLVKKGDTRFQSFKELLDYAKAHPDQSLSFGMTGKLSLRHAVLAQLLSQIDLPNISLVPMGGDLDIINAISGGHIDAGVADLITNEMTLPIGFFGAKGNPDMPDVPTFKSMGYDIDMAGSYILWAHKDIPEDQFKVLQDAMKKVANDQAVQDMARKMGLVPHAMFDEELEAKTTSISKALDDLIANKLIVPEAR